MDTLDDILANLAPDSLLQALGADELDALLKRATPKKLSPGEVIINQGDEDGDFAVFILSGALKISLVSASGREIILNYAAPGEIVGEIALLDSGPRTATVSASEASRVLILPTHSFIDIVTANPSSMVGVMRALAGRVRELNRVIESDRTFSMGPRLARALVRLMDSEREDGRLRHNLSQSDLGAFAGLARENVSRLLSDWEEDGVIAREGRDVLVNDAEYLRDLAEFGGEA